MELVLLILTSLGHIVVVLATAGSGNHRPEQIYNLAAVVLWGIYLAARCFIDRSFLREVGFKAQGFPPAFRDSFLFGVIATVPLAVLGFYFSRYPIPATFWLMAGVYPLWGIAQQFALQALINRNLRPVILSKAWRIVVTAILFSLAHFPDRWIMLLTAVGGLGFTWLYERHRNLWAVGIVHGWLGAAAYYLVLGEDLGATLLRLL